MGFMDSIKKWFAADKETASAGIPQADPDKNLQADLTQGVQPAAEEEAKPAEG
jgi:hypothetical protein